MRTIVLFFCLVVLISCGAGYHRVRYAEMTKPPIVTLRENELVVTTRNPEGEGLSVYKVDIEIRDKAKIIELRGYQAIGKPEKTEFKISLNETQLRWIEGYKVYWLNPGGKKNHVQMTISK